MQEDSMQLRSAYWLQCCIHAASVAHALACIATATAHCMKSSHTTSLNNIGASSGGSSSSWSSDSRQLAVVAPSSDAGVSRDKPQWEEGVYHGGVITDETERLAAIATCHSVAINYILVSSSLVTATATSMPCEPALRACAVAVHCALITPVILPARGLSSSTSSSGSCSQC
jgi:hypothetical protein